MSSADQARRNDSAYWAGLTITRHQLLRAVRSATSVARAWARMAGHGPHRNMIAKVNAIDGVVPSPYEREVTTGRSSPNTTRAASASRATGSETSPAWTIPATAATRTAAPARVTVHSSRANRLRLNGDGATGWPFGP